MSYPKAYKIQLTDSKKVKWVGHATYLKHKKAGNVLNVLDSSYAFNSSFGRHNVI